MEQGTRYEVPLKQCRSIVENGMYNPFIAPKQEQADDKNRVPADRRHVAVIGVKGAPLRIRSFAVGMAAHCPHGSPDPCTCTPFLFFLTPLPPNRFCVFRLTSARWALPGEGSNRATP